MLDKLKTKFIYELIKDILFVSVLIVVTIFAVICFFPKIAKVKVTTLDEYNCSRSTSCECPNFSLKCKCKYQDNYGETKEVKCKKKDLLS